MVDRPWSRWAVAGLSADAAGISLATVAPGSVHEHGDRLAAGERLRVDLLGRAVPVVRTPDGPRAVSKGKPGNPVQIEKYLAGKFGARLEEARAAMAELAAGREPADLYRRGFRLYERFRPEVPKGESGWGAKGELDVAEVRSADDIRQGGRSAARSGSTRRSD